MRSVLLIVCGCALEVQAGGDPFEMIMAGMGFAPTPQPDLSGPVAVLDESNFVEALDKSESQIWMLKFYAPWCGHCKKLAPVIEDAALKVHKLRFAKIDATKHKALAQRYRVSGFPSLMWVRDGRVRNYNGPRTVEGFRAFSDALEEEAVAEVPRSNSEEQAMGEQLIDFLSSRLYQSTLTSSKSDTAKSSAFEHNAVVVLGMPAKDAASEKQTMYNNVKLAFQQLGKVFQDEVACVIDTRSHPTARAGEGNGVKILPGGALEVGSRGAGSGEDRTDADVGQDLLHALTLTHTDHDSDNVGVQRYRFKDTSPYLAVVTKTPGAEGSFTIVHMGQAVMAQMFTMANPASGDSKAMSKRRARTAALLMEQWLESARFTVGTEIQGRRYREIIKSNLAHPVSQEHVRSLVLMAITCTVDQSNWARRMLQATQGEMLEVLKKEEDPHGFVTGENLWRALFPILRVGFEKESSKYNYWANMVADSFGVRSDLCLGSLPAASRSSDPKSQSPPLVHFVVVEKDHPNGERYYTGEPHGRAFGVPLPASGTEVAGELPQKLASLLLAARANTAHASKMDTYALPAKLWRKATAMYEPLSALDFLPQYSLAAPLAAWMLYLLYLIMSFGEDDYEYAPNGRRLRKRQGVTRRHKED